MSSEKNEKPEHKHDDKKQDKKKKRSLLAIIFFGIIFFALVVTFIFGVIQKFWSNNDEKNEQNIEQTENTANNDTDDSENVDDNSKQQSQLTQTESTKDDDKKQQDVNDKQPEKKKPTLPQVPNVKWSKLTQHLLDLERNRVDSLRLLIKKYPPPIELTTDRDSILMSAITSEEDKTDNIVFTDIKWSQLGQHLLDIEQNRSQIIIHFVEQFPVEPRFEAQPN